MTTQTDSAERARRWREANRERIRAYRAARPAAGRARAERERANQTRAVLRRGGTNVSARCEACGEWVDSMKGPSVVANVFEGEAWSHTAHYHVSCYVNQYGPVSS